MIGDGRREDAGDNGQGRRSRAASTKDNSCVLSPTSATATSKVEVRKASK